MRSIRKGLALALVLAMAVLAGCSSKKTEEQPNASTAPKAPVEITFWHGMSPDAAHGKALTALIKKFNDTHQDIKVVETYQGSYTDLETKLTAAIAAQTPPTLVQNTDSMLTNLVRAKAVQPLDTLIPKTELDDYVPALLKATTFDGKLMALPFNKSALLLIYNKNLVKKVPTNWTEFAQVAKEVTVPGKTYGTAISGNVYDFAQHYAQAGGEWLSADGKSTPLNSDAGVQALQFLVDLIKSGAAVQLKPNEYQSNYFNEGRAAMIATTSASFAYINPADKSPWGVAPLYAGPKNAAVPLSGANISILNGIKPEQQKAAVTFLTWLTGKDATIEFAMSKTGYGPIRKSAMNDPKWQDFVKQNPEYGILANALPNGVIQPAIAPWQNVQKAITTAVQKALLGQATPKAALDEAVTAANAALQK